MDETKLVAIARFEADASFDDVDRKIAARKMALIAIGEPGEPTRWRPPG
jgi:hypothetical protein